MRFLIFCISVCLLGIVLITSIESVALDRSFYWNEFTKKATVQAYPSAWLWHQEIIRFHKNHSQNLPSELTEEEVRHLIDVRTFYQVLKQVRQVLIISVVLLLVSMVALKRNEPSPIFLACGYTGVVGLGLLLIVMFGILGDFSYYFHKMHVLMFPVGSYTFESNSLLVSLYPPALFMKMAYQIAIKSIIGFTLLLLLGTPALLRGVHGRRRDHNSFERCDWMSRCTTGFSVLRKRFK